MKNFFNNLWTSETAFRSFLFGVGSVLEMVPDLFGGAVLVGVALQTLSLGVGSKSAPKVGEVK